MATDLTWEGTNWAGVIQPEWARENLKETRQVPRFNTIERLHLAPHIKGQNKAANDKDNRDGNTEEFDIGLQ